MNGQTVLITGACGGLGSALAKKLAEQGSDLLLLDRKAACLDRLADEIDNTGVDRPGVCALDLAQADDAAYEQLSDIISQHYSGVDAFIHCAASFDGLRPFHDQPLSEWEECLAVNLTAAWKISALVLPYLKDSGQGRVVLPMEDHHEMVAPYSGAYGVSKQALHGLASLLDAELEHCGAKVIRFTPGAMRTELRARAYISEDPETLRDPSDAAVELIKLLA